MGQSPWQILSCVVVVWRTHRGGLVPPVFKERSEVPLVTLNLCVMRRYNLGEGDLASTSPGSKQVKYLGHVISAEGINIGNDRIKAISELPDPKNSKELGSFFGYYRFRSPGCSKRFRNHCALGCWVLSILYAGLIQTFKKSLRPWLNLPRSNF